MRDHASYLTCGKDIGIFSYILACRPILRSHDHDDFLVHNKQLGTQITLVSFQLIIIYIYIYIKTHFRDSQFLFENKGSKAKQNL